MAHSIWVRFSLVKNATRDEYINDFQHARQNALACVMTLKEFFNSRETCYTKSYWQDVENCIMMRNETEYVDFEIIEQ